MRRLHVALLLPLALEGPPSRGLGAVHGSGASAGALEDLSGSRPPVLQGSHSFGLPAHRDSLRLTLINSRHACPFKRRGVLLDCYCHCCPSLLFLNARPSFDSLSSMPTQDDASLLPPLAPVSDHALHATCPPEDERQAATPHSPLTPYQPVTVNAFRPESANHASSINAPTQHPPASVSVGVAELPASVPLDSASTQHTQEEVTSPAAACRLSRGDEQANSKSTVTVAPTSPSPLPPPPRRTVSPKATYVRTGRFSVANFCLSIFSLCPSIHLRS